VGKTNQVIYTVCFHSIQSKMAEKALMIYLTYWYLWWW